MTQKQMDRVLQFCKKHQLADLEPIKVHGQYALRRIGVFNYTFIDYEATMHFLRRQKVMGETLRDAA